MQITLNHLRDPNRPILAIKALRSATGLGLRETKGIVDAVRGANGMPRPQTISIYEHSVAEVNNEFITEIPATPASLGGQSTMISRNALLDFVLDLLTNLDPDDADRVRRLPSWGQVRRAL